MNRHHVTLLALLAACPKSGDKPKPVEPARHGDAGGSAARLLPDDPGAVPTLPPAAPLPAVPASLPAPPANPRVTAEAVAFGELLFFDPRLSSDGTRSCATCHVPARGYSGAVDNAVDGKPNLRRTPAIVNLAWVKEFGWDGRSASLTSFLHGHIAGQLDRLASSAAVVAAVPTYAAHIARVGGTPEEAIVQALEAYVATRYDGDAPWDAQERTARITPGSTSSDPVVAGFQLFRGKAQCAVCHPPPLYSDGGYHAIVAGTHGDRGRGFVDPTHDGAFRTPTLRGAARRAGYFHTGQATSLADAIKLHATALSDSEVSALSAFVTALASDHPAPSKPLLP